MAEPDFNRGNLQPAHPAPDGELAALPARHEVLLGQQGVGCHVSGVAPGRDYVNRVTARKLNIVENDCRLEAVRVG